MSAKAGNSEAINGFDLPVDSKGWCITRKVEDVKYKFVWKIENFSEEMLKPNKAIIQSSEFTVMSPDKNLTSWKLRIDPNGNTTESIGYLSFFLENQEEKKITVKLSTFSILNANKEEKHKDRIKQAVFQPNSLPNQSVTNGFSSWGRGKWVKHDKLKGEAAAELLPEDSLTVVCETTIAGSQKTNLCGFKHLQTEDTNKIKSSGHDGETMIPGSAYAFAFNDKAFSDVKIACGDRVFDCHRIILSSRSSVFRAMFEHDMEEAKTKRVEIKEAKSDVVHAMLEHIYTGKTNFPSTEPKDMLAAAEMYNLESLKNEYEEILCKTLDISNCIDLLVVGDLNNAAYLKKSAMQLIAMNMSSILKNKDWKEKLIRYPVLMAELMENTWEVSEPPRKRARTENSQPVRTPAQ